MEKVRSSKTHPKSSGNIFNFVLLPFFLSVAAGLVDISGFELLTFEIILRPLDLEFYLYVSNSKCRG